MRPCVIEILDYKVKPYPLKRAIWPGLSSGAPQKNKLTLNLIHYLFPLVFGGAPEKEVAYGLCYNAPLLAEPDPNVA